MFFFSICYIFSLISKFQKKNLNIWPQEHNVVNHGCRADSSWSLSTKKANLLNGPVSTVREILFLNITATILWPHSPLRPGLWTASRSVISECVSVLTGVCVCVCPVFAPLFFPFYLENLHVYGGKGAALARWPWPRLSPTYYQPAPVGRLSTVHWQRAVRESLRAVYTQNGKRLQTEAVPLCVCLHLYLRVCGLRLQRL